MTTIIGHGIYTIPEAARLTGLRTSRVREWFRGHTGKSKPVFGSDYAMVDGDFAISFHDLIDVYVAGQLRTHGVSMPTVRKVYRKLQHELKIEHPFCHQQLLTHGKTVLTSGLDERGREEIIEVLTGQRVFPEVIKPFLQTIDYDAASLARRWRIADRVVVDPGIQFGKPIVENTRIATHILAGAFQANDRDAELVADWYNVTADDVLAAVGFEAKQAA